MNPDLLVPGIDTHVKEIHQKRRSKKVKSNDSFDEDTQIQSAVGQIVVHFPKTTID